MCISGPKPAFLLSLVFPPMLFPLEAAAQIHSAVGFGENVCPPPRACAMARRGPRIARSRASRARPPRRRRVATRDEGFAHGPAPGRGGNRQGVEFADRPEHRRARATGGGAERHAVRERGQQRVALGDRPLPPQGNSRPVAARLRAGFNSANFVSRRLTSALETRWGERPRELSTILNPARRESRPT